MARILARVGRFGTAVTLAMALGSGTLAAFQLLSVQDEIQMGRDAQTALVRELPQVRDPAVRAYVSNLGRELAGYASGADYPYSFSTADDPDLNAFALPGGPIWINRGVLDVAENEAQVAGVLAHEIAHVAGRHSARQMTKSLWTTGLLYVVGMAVSNADDWRANAINLGAALAGGTMMMKFSRNDEKAADRDGVALLEQAGYDPRGLLEFMELLDAKQTRTPNAVVKFFSTHPAPRDRVRNLTSLLDTHAQNGRRDSPEFERTKRRLAQLPAPQARP